MFGWTSTVPSLPWDFVLIENSPLLALSVCGSLIVQFCGQGTITLLYVFKM